MRCLLQGKTSKDRVATARKIGQAKRKSGCSRLARPLPLHSQITISLSRYILDRLAMMAIKRLMVSSVGKKPSTVYPITRVTSDGLKLPRDACPRVRMSIIVITTVTSTISVAPKLRDSSRRKEEWNNIGKQGKA